MNIFQAIILGVIQGITEFLPISSSGHLVFVPVLFGWPDQGLTFDVMVHLGSLVAVVVYFRKRLWQVLISFFTNDHPKMRRFGLILLMSIIPAGVVGLLLGDVIESNLRSTTVVAWSLIFWGVMLYLAERHLEKQKEEVHVTWKNGLFVACAQAIALIPGTSRSGITMTAGMFAGFRKKDAAEFSFLMSVPVILVAGGMKVLELAQGGFVASVSVAPMIAGFVAAAASGFLAIAGLMKIVEKWSFRPFVVYRIVIGILILILL